jgi:hypothetical protein
VDAALPQPVSRTAGARAPWFGTAALVLAVLTLVLPVLIMLSAGERADKDTSDPSHVWGPIAILIAGGVFAVFAMGVSGALGTLTGGVALARGEASTWRAVIGLFVNVPAVLFVLYLLAVVRASNGG